MMQQAENRSIPLSTVNKAWVIEVPEWAIEVPEGLMLERVEVAASLRAPTLHGGLRHESHWTHIRPEALTKNLNGVERIVAGSFGDQKH